ncbi:uncharacterized protein [Henckelia pumila]|uniref:uncharacterized protein n=1 Tax=Henckelia pumila TaxID=405737 RepID=UPI003C6E1463
MIFMVEQTQFGNLIKYAAEYNLSSQILWFMMMRQTYVTGDDDEMWFVVNDRPIRFFRMEYGLITWLEYSDNFPEEVLEVSDFCDRYFQGINKVSVMEVEMKLKELKSVDELLTIERVKMACVYFVSGVLWPLAPVKNPLVDKKNFNLIDDFDAFNKYPWGMIAFKGAIHDLKYDLKKKEVVLSENIGNGKRSNSGTHDMVGFIYPLQILAYKCVCGIGERFAKQREGDNTSLPRICQWISNKLPKKGSPRYIDILNASKSGKKIIRSILSPTDQESTAPYIRNIFIEDFIDSDLSFINSLLLEGKSVYCIRNPALCESKKTLQSKEEDQESKLCLKNKSTRSSKIDSAKKAPAHQAERVDVLGESNIIRQVKAL